MSNTPVPQINPLAIGEQFTEAQRGAIAHYVGLELNHPALLPFLATAATMGLNPLNGEIWLLKGQRDNGEDFYRPAVGRDGYLKKARESENWKGIRSDVVRLKDSWTVEHTQDGTNFVHRHAELGEKAQSPEAEGDPENYRGPVVGAWAIVTYKDDTDPFFFFAPIEEYARTKTVVIDGDTRKVPDGTWSYLSAMILKCAQSYVCRIGHGISGAIPVDELRGGQLSENQPGVQRDERIDANPDAENDALIDALEDVEPETRKLLKEALHEVNVLTPFSWAPAKVTVVLSNADQGKAEGNLANLEHEISAMRRRIEREEKEAEARREAEGVPAIQVIPASDVQPGQMVTIVGAKEDKPWPVGGVAKVEGRIQIEAADEGDHVELEKDDEIEVHDVPNPMEEEADRKADQE